MNNFEALLSKLLLWHLWSICNGFVVRQLWFTSGRPDQGAVDGNRQASAKSYGSCPPAPSYAAWNRSVICQRVPQLRQALDILQKVANSLRMRFLQTNLGFGAMIPKKVLSWRIWFCKINPFQSRVVLLTWVVTCHIMVVQHVSSSQKGWTKPLVGSKPSETKGCLSNFG